MPYVFKSPATGDILVLNETAKQLLEIIGKDPSPPGIITVAQMEDAIRKLKQAVALEKASLKQEHLKSETDDDLDHDDDNQEDKSKSMYVSLEQRVWPFIEMLKASQKANEDVVWGV